MTLTAVNGYPDDHDFCTTLVEADRAPFMGPARTEPQAWARLDSREGRPLNRPAVRHGRPLAHGRCRADR